MTKMYCLKNDNMFHAACCVVFQASMWPSIPLVVPQATLGTAMGLATSIQMIGIGISNLVVGQILGTTSRQEELQIMSLFLRRLQSSLTSSVCLFVFQ